MMTLTKKTIILFCVLLTFSNAVFAQDNGANLTSKTEIEIPLKRWEIRTAPVTLLFSWGTLDLAYRLNKNISFGPSAIFYGCTSDYGGMFTPCFDGSAVGANVSYYFKSVTKNTWYLSTHAYYENYKAKPHDKMGYEDVSGSQINSALGYQWKGKMIQVLLGGGVIFGNHNVDEHFTSQNSTSYSTSGTAPFLEFKVGIEI